MSPCGLGAGREAGDRGRLSARRFPFCGSRSALSPSEQGSRSQCPSLFSDDIQGATVWSGAQPRAR
eukprot:10518822-Alexandrium_andersonii.AAC.1